MSFRISSYSMSRKLRRWFYNYFYRDSKSDFACALVIAPKNGPQFIRFAGDYRPINKYIIIGHSPIPHVFQSLLEIIKKYKVFADLDMANSFHYFSLTPYTSEMLSIQTPCLGSSGSEVYA